MSLVRSRDLDVQGHAYKVTRQSHVSGLHVIDFLDPKNHRKKNFISLACIVPEMRCHL